MKKSFSKLLTILPVLSMAMILLVLVSCRSVNSVQEVRSSEVQKFRSVDTIVMRDSVFISERQKGDTVYLTRTEWRERWRTRIERDTVVDVRVEKEVVQLPPQRYVPKFYKWCTGLLFAIGLLAIGRFALKLWCRV